MVAFTRDAWKGDTKTLLIAVDVGTTFTAASFSILEPEVVPVFQEVRLHCRSNTFTSTSNLRSGSTVAEAGEGTLSARRDAVSSEHTHDRRFRTRRSPPSCSMIEPLDPRPSVLRPWTTTPSLKRRSRTGQRRNGLLHIHLLRVTETRAQLL
jgi:hypothetical protein